MRLKKLLIILLILILAATGCGKGSTQNEEDDDETTPVLTVVSLEPFSSFVPSCASTKTDLFIVHHLFEGLFRYDQSGQVVNGLSVSEKSNETNTIWTFEIDPESLWSDGIHVCADDFVYSIEYALTADQISEDSLALLLSIENAGSYLNGSCAIEEVGIKAVSDNTLEVRFNTPVSHISTVMSQPLFFPMRRDKSAVYSSGTNTLASGSLPCNGSYTVSEQTDDQIVFAENTKRSSTVPLKNSGFVLDIRKTMAEVSFAEHKDYLVLLQEPLVFQSEDFRLESTAGFGTTFLRFNLTTPEYINQDLRSVLQLSIRNQDVVSQLGLPYYPAEGFLSTAFTSDNNVTGFRKNYSPCNVSETAHANNVLVAQTMLNDSAVSSLPLTLVYNRENALQKAIAPILHDMWKSSLNIEVTPIGLNRFDYQDHLENNDYSLILETKTLDLDMPHLMLDSFRSDSMSNYGHYSSIRYDSCYQNCVKASAFQDYNDYCMQADTILFEDAAVIPLIYQTHFYIVSSEFSDYTLLPNGLALIN